MSKALATQETSVATQESFALTLPTKEVMIEIMTQNMEGVDLKFDRIKIPSSGSTTWEVPDEDGNMTETKEIIGIVIDHHPVNAYWKEKFTGENNPPDCSAMDAHTGTMTMDSKPMLCSTCPMNQFGSDPEGGKGKACKNLQRVYLIRSGEVFPLLLALPPSSLENFRTYARRLTGKMKAFTSVVTRITLEKDKSDGGIIYSKAVFSRVDNLSKTDAGRMTEHAKMLKPYLRQIALTEDEVGGPVSNPVNSGDVRDGTHDNVNGQPIGDDGWK